MGDIESLFSFEFVLGLVNFVFALSVLQTNAARKRKTYTFWFICLFLSMSFASLSKIIVDVIYETNYAVGSVSSVIFLLILGLTGMAAWNIGAKIVFKKRSRLKVQKFSFVFYGIFFLSVLISKYDYFLLLIHNSSAIIFLLYAFVIQFYRRWQKEVAFGVLGVFMLLLAIIVNQMSGELTEEVIMFTFFFNAISLVASSLIFYSAKPLVKNDIN